MKFIDLTGKRFSRWTVQKHGANKSFACGASVTTWECVCDCGNTGNVTGGSLRSGGSLSCGCIRDEILIKHGKYKTRTYRIRMGMIMRCENPKEKAWKDYGGRGIKVCDRWRDSFEAFLEDMGEPPSRDHCIERVDNNGNYEPSNCIWATMSEQLRNRRNTCFLTAFGETLCVEDWSKRYGIHRNTLKNRLDRGWDIEKAITLQAWGRTKS